MKKLLSPIIALALLLNGCSTFNWGTLSDATITSAVSVATAAGLRYAITSSSERTTVANYINTYAAALRTITGTPTPDQLTTQINGFIPSSVKNSVPELVSFVIPLVVSTYQAEYAKIGANAAKLYAVLNDIATGLEAGSSPWITHTPQT